MTQRPYATVVVPTYNRPKELGDVLDDLLAQDAETGTFEVVVADSLPSSGTARERVVERRGREVAVRYVADPRHGAFNARHSGARIAHGEVLVYIDDDVRIPPGWLRALLAPLADEDVGCVGGRIVPRWEGGEPAEWTTRVPLDFFSVLDFGDEPLDVKPPLCVNSGNMAVRRELLWAAGGFRPCTFGNRRLLWLAGDGEAGLVRALQARGVRVRYEPAAELAHRLPAARFTERYMRSRARLQGIEHSFIWTRIVHPSATRSLRHAGACLLGAAFSTLQRKPVRRAYWVGRGLHQAGVAVLPPFRAYVMRPSYVDAGAAAAREPVRVGP
jgi:glycosyltransferase involved in cell wall biosynthesis